MALNRALTRLLRPRLVLDTVFNPALFVLGPDLRTCSRDCNKFGLMRAPSVHHGVELALRRPRLPERLFHAEPVL